MKLQEITQHAIRRAEERLGISEAAFREWVALTSEHWIPVNAAYLHERNVACTQFSRLFITPWVDGQAVALVCSEDNALKTVIRFHDSRYRQDADREIKALALCKVAKERYAEVDGLLGKLLRVPLGGPLAEEALRDYLDGRLSLEDLEAVLRAKHIQRQQVLNSLRRVA